MVDQFTETDFHSFRDPDVGAKDYATYWSDNLSEFDARIVRRGLQADRPAASDEGRIWITTDPGAQTVYLDSGDSWIAIAGSNLATQVVERQEVQLSDGDAGDPALTFRDDENVGLYRPGGDQLGVATAGELAVTVDSAQDVALASGLTVEGWQIVDAVAHGADPTGSNTNLGTTLNSIASEYGDNTLVVLRPGTYNLDTTFAPHDNGVSTNFGVIATSEGATVKQDTTTDIGASFFLGSNASPLDKVLVRGLTFDATIDNGGTRAINTRVNDRLVVENCEYAGGIYHHTSTILVSVLTADGHAEIRNWRAPDGAESDFDDGGTGSEPTGISMHPNHAGTAVWRNCVVVGFPGNGAYLSQPGEDGHGKVIVDGGYFAHNSTSNVRLSDGGVVRDATIELDEDPTGTVTSPNMRGIWLYDGDVTVRNVNISVPGDNLSASAVSHCISIRDTVESFTIVGGIIENNVSANSINIAPVDSGAGVEDMGGLVSGVTFTGTAGNGTAEETIKNYRDNVEFNACVVDQPNQIGLATGGACTVIGGDYTNTGTGIDIGLDGLDAPASVFGVSGDVTVGGSVTGATVFGADSLTDSGTDTLHVDAGGAANYPDGAQYHGDLTDTDGNTVYSQSDNWVPQDRLENDSLTVAGQSVSLGGSTAIASGDLSDGGDIVLTSRFPLPNSDLANDTITVAGQSVSLGGSTTLASTDLSDSGDIAMLDEAETVTGGWTIDGVLTLGDNAADPSANGEFARNGGDVKVYSGGAVRNITNIGSGGGGVPSLDDGERITFGTDDDFTMGFVDTGSQLTIRDSNNDTFLNILTSSTPNQTRIYNSTLKLQNDLAGFTDVAIAGPNDGTGTAGSAGFLLERFDGTNEWAFSARNDMQIVELKDSVSGVAHFEVDKGGGGGRTSFRSGEQMHFEKTGTGGLDARFRGAAAGDDCLIGTEDGDGTRKFRLGWLGGPGDFVILNDAASAEQSMVISDAGGAPNFPQGIESGGDPVPKSSTGTEYDIQKDGTDGAGIINFKTT